MFGNLGNLASVLKQAPEMLRQAQQMQERMKEMREKLGRLRVEGAAGGGMVRVEASGQQQILKVQIEESLLNSDDREMLEDLVASATNQALEKAREAAAEELNKISGDVEIPGLGEALAKMGLDQTGE